MSLRVAAVGQLTHLQCGCEYCMTFLTAFTTRQRFLWRPVVPSFWRALRH